MPNTQAAKKALRQSERRRVRNLSQKRELKRTIKSFDNTLSGGDIDGAKKQLVVIYKALDKAAKVGVIKKNKASRLKSRLSIRLNKTENPKRVEEVPTPTEEVLEPQS